MRKMRLRASNLAKIFYTPMLRARRSHAWGGVGHRQRPGAAAAL